MHNPNRGRYSAGAILAIAGALAIAAGLLAVSYGHVYAFAIAAGAEPWEARIIAATVDGLIVVALGVLGAYRRAGIAAPWQVRAGLIVGIAATTGANVVDGLGHGPAGVVLALWVPLAAELAYQLALVAIALGRVRPAAPVSAGADSAETVPDTRPAAPDVEAEPGERVRVCGGWFALGDVEARLCELDDALAEAAAVKLVRELRRGGADISLRKLAAKYPRHGAPRSTHWATQVKRQAAEVSEAAAVLSVVPDTAAA